MVVGDFAKGTQVAVIGGGPGGYVAAIRAAQLGLEVTLVEREHLGGVCLNRGCIPSKALIHAAGLKAQIDEGVSTGLLTGTVALDLTKLNEWKRGIVGRLRTGVGALLQQHKVEVVAGTARLTGDRTFEVERDDGRRRFEFEHLILATGSSAVDLPQAPRDGVGVIDSTDALEPAQVPERLVVIGAGAVGLELGMVYAKIGSQVTLVSDQDRLLPMLDPQIVRVVEGALKRRGISLIVGAKVLGTSRKGDTVIVRYATPAGETSIEAERVLVAAGRRPNTAGIGLEAAGVPRDARGFVGVDARMQTAVDGILAIGDIVAGPMLAHRASYQGKVAAEVIAGQPSAFDRVAVPAVIFSDPEIAVVGLTEGEAAARGIAVKSGVFPFRALGRTMTLNYDGAGFVKVVSDAERGTVLGVHIVGPNASDLIAEGCLAVSSASHVDDLSLTMHPHPTLSEGILEAAERIEQKAIHIFSPRDS